MKGRTRRQTMRTAALLAACALLSTLAGGASLRPSAASALGPPPQVDQAVVATFTSGQVNLTGTNLGLAISSRSIRFDYDGASMTIDASTSYVQAWSATAITFNTPPPVRSGRLTVIVDGQSSAPVDTYVYIYSTTSTQLASNPTPLPLALTTTPDGRVWMDEEFHTQLKVATPGTAATAVSAITVPQYAPPGIFSVNANGADYRSTFTMFGEDIDTDSDGSLWFVQGGAGLYTGSNINSSRIIHYTPSSGRFDCYNVPVDDAEAAGVLVDHARGVVWYSEFSLTHGNAIDYFIPSQTTPDCSWNPDSGARPATCPGMYVAGCHMRFPLPQANSGPIELTLDAAGNVWFTEFWGNRIGMLNPVSGVITELPLPASIDHSGPGAFIGSGPFSIALDRNGDLWVSEQFDATIDRISPSRMASSNCTQLNALGRNPCIDELYVGSNGTDGITVHTVTVGNDGLVWFTVAGSAAGIGGSLFPPLNTNNPSRIGLISLNRNAAVALLPPLVDVKNLSGITQDPNTGDVWFGEYSDRKLARLQNTSLDQDGDGITNTNDNCPTTYNPDQKNTDGDLINLAPWGKVYNDVTNPNSDKLGDACDDDKDNDGLTNAQETSLGPGGANHSLCPSATANTDPLKMDTDGDGVADKAECLLGSDPASAASKPSPPVSADDPDRDGLSTSVETQIGTDPNNADTDGDGVRDSVEVKGYNTNPLAANTDGDACGDAREIASINGDNTVNSIDLSQVAGSFGPATSGAYVPDFDSDRNGTINATDLAFVARSFGPCP